MGTCAIGDMLDQGWAQPGAGPLDCPFCSRIDGQIIVAINTQGRDAETMSACCKGCCVAACDALEGGDGPLIVDDVQDNGRLIGGGKNHSRMEV